jgi:hypothetical protein
MEMTQFRFSLFLSLACAACGGGPVEVDHPFYLDALEDQEAALFRCPNGPDEGCAIDGLPGPGVLAAGADERHVVVQSTSGYYYFARIKRETRGWGDDPERIVGPLDERAFAEAKARLDLPELSVRP